MKLIFGGLDLETTGLEQSLGHRIIETAIILHQYDDVDFSHKEVFRYEQRINPKRSIDPGAQAVHGISFESLTGCPTWEEVAPKIAKIMSKCDFLVAHNGDSFDLPFISMELLRVGVAVPTKPLSVDTMTGARWATPGGKYPNLGELCFACGVDYDKALAHAATYDVEVMLQCFFKGLAGGFYTLPVKKERV